MTASSAWRQASIQARGSIEPSHTSHGMGDGMKHRQVGGGGTKGSVMHRSGWWMTRESGRGRGAKSEKVDLSSGTRIIGGVKSEPVGRLGSSESTREFIKARNLEGVLKKRMGRSSGTATHVTGNAQSDSIKMVSSPACHLTRAPKPTRLSLVPCALYPAPRTFCPVLTHVSSHTTYPLHPMRCTLYPIPYTPHHIHAQSPTPYSHQSAVQPPSKSKCCAAALETAGDSRK